MRIIRTSVLVLAAMILAAGCDQMGTPHEKPSDAPYAADPDPEPESPATDPETPETPYEYPHVDSIDGMIIRIEFASTDRPYFHDIEEGTFVFPGLPAVVYEAAEELIPPPDGICRAPGCYVWRGVEVEKTCETTISRYSDAEWHITYEVHGTLDMLTNNPKWEGTLSDVPGLFLAARMMYTYIVTDTLVFDEPTGYAPSGSWRRTLTMEPTHPDGHPWPEVATRYVTGKELDGLEIQVDVTLDFATGSGHRFGWVGTRSFPAPDCGNLSNLRIYS